MYNKLKKDIEESPVYKKFRELDDAEWGKILKLVNSKKIGEAMIVILKEEYPSEKLKALAYDVIKEFPSKGSSFETEITKTGRDQALKTGMGMRAEGYELPDVIYVSPYKRTKQTLEYLIKGWPELGKVKVVEYVRLREQEHGIQDIFNNARLAHVFMPKEALFKAIESGYAFRYSNGESLLDVINRHSDFFKHLYRKYIGKKVMVIGHHLGLLSILAIIQNWDREKFLYEDENNTPINAGVSIFEPKDIKNISGKMALKEYNKKFY